MQELGLKAREAARVLGVSTHETRNKALGLIAQALVKNEAAILAANEKDLAEGASLSEALRDRLRLTPARINGIAQAVSEIIDLPDPVGRLLFEDNRPNGLHIRRVSVPLGVLAVIYEARPNVTLDAAAMALKSGNAVILRGGKEAYHSNQALVELVRGCLEEAGLPADCVQLVQDLSRDSALQLMRLKGYVDLLIPRGGKALIRSALDNALVPVLETGEGVCHVYVDKAADLQMARDIVVNAKVNRPSTCNAAECLLVHKDVLQEALALLGPALEAAGVELRADKDCLACLPHATAARDDDWGMEYNALILAVKAVDDVEDAMRHIATYGTRHSEAIITRDEAAKQRFFAGVDAAALYHNASTRFTDGGEFGFGAEIGISTQKLHCRGPVDIKALCTYKYLIDGEGQLRA